MQIELDEKQRFDLRINKPNEKSQKVNIIQISKMPKITKNYMKQSKIISKK